MPIVESKIEIGRSPSDVFQLAQDYDLRLEWDPFLRDMKFLNGASRAEVGVEVWVKAKNGFEMTVEYISLVEPHTVSMKMLRGPFFFKHFAGTWKFRELSTERTEVVFRYNFETRPGIIRPVLSPIIRRVFNRDIRLRLQGLKTSAEETNILERLYAKGGKIHC